MTHPPATLSGVVMSLAALSADEVVQTEWETETRSGTLGRYLDLVAARFTNFTPSS